MYRAGSCGKLVLGIESKVCKVFVLVKIKLRNMNAKKYQRKGSGLKDGFNFEGRSGSCDCILLVLSVWGSEFSTTVGWFNK